MALPEPIKPPLAILQKVYLNILNHHISAEPAACGIQPAGSSPNANLATPPDTCTLQQIAYSWPRRTRCPQTSSIFHGLMVQTSRTGRIPWKWRSTLEIHNLRNMEMRICLDTESV